MDLEDLTRLAASFLMPLAEAVEDPEAESILIGDLGFVLPPGATFVAGTRQALEGLASVAVEVAEFDETGGGSATNLLLQLAPALRDTIQGVVNLAQSIDAATAGSALVANTDILKVLPRRLGDYLLVDFLERELPFTSALLRLIGIIELEQVTHEGDPYLQSFTQRTVDWEKLPRFFSDPVALLKELYAFDSPQGIDTVVLFERLRAVALALGLRSDIRAVDVRAKIAFDEALNGAGQVPADENLTLLRVPFLPTTDVNVGAELYPLADPSGRVDGLGIAVYVEGQLAASIPLTDWLSAELNLAAYASGFGVALRTGMDPKVVSAIFTDDPAAVLDQVALDTRVVFDYHSPDGGPIVLFGSQGTTRFQIDGFALTLGLSKPLASPVDIYAQMALSQAALIVQSSESDAFLQAALGDGFTVKFDFSAGFSTCRGLYFPGSPGLDFDIRLGAQAGPVFIDRAGISIKSSSDETRLVVTVTGGLAIGPIAAVVQDIGIALQIDPKKPGLLGNADLSIGFKPPTGVGLLIDAEVVKGAGFILNDYERGRYAGGLSLSIADVVSVDALGLITTTLPDGSEGFSMLVILTATFPPIQLGFGFTLTGLGGLLGVHRTMDLPVLRDKVRTGVLDSILFPVNPLGRIVQVLNDVESVFPIARDRFTVGLMARLGWGSPQIIQADIGLILSLPMPISIALLGRVSAILPDPEAAIVELRIDVAGGLDLGRQELWIEAVLRDSRVAIFELSGGFALRSSWGPDPVFLLSVGGFNPHFTPPPDFRAPDRLAISLATSDNPRIRLESYLAITSNSLQIGARLDAFGSIEALGFWSAQVYASFDALFTFEPFQFIVDLAGGVQICHDGKPFLGASFLLSLQGPEPLRAIGHVEVVFLGTHRIPLDITVGTGREQAAITAADPATLLAAAIKDQRNWSAVPPVLQQAVVTRDPEGAGLLVHPAGSLTFRQRVVPLEVQFVLFGGQPVPGGPAQFTLTYAVGGPPPTNPALTSIRDAWAPADLFPLSDAERISQPSFTQLVSGHSGIGSTTGGTSGPGVTVNLDEFETSVIDADDWLPRRMSRPTGEPSISAAVLSGAHRASLAQSGDRWGARAESMAVTCVEPQYRVVAADSLTPQGDTLFDSWVEAGASAGGDPRLLVVPAHEARAR